MLHCLASLVITSAWYGFPMFCTYLFRSSCASNCWIFLRMNFNSVFFLISRSLFSFWKLLLCGSSQHSAMIIFSTSVCVVLWSCEVFSLDAYFLGWSNWWDPWLLWTPEKYILNFHMDLRAPLLWCTLMCSCNLSSLLLFSYVYRATWFCLFGCICVDHMVTVRGSDLVVSKIGFSVYPCAPCFFAILVLALQFGYHQAPREGSFASVVISSNVAWVSRLCTRLFPSFCGWCQWVFLDQWSLTFMEQPCLSISVEVSLVQALLVSIFLIQFSSLFIEIPYLVVRSAVIQKFSATTILSTSAFSGFSPDAYVCCDPTDEVSYGCGHLVGTR